MITSKERSILKSKCNTLKPSVNIGKSGLSLNIITEIETVLFHNEIAKINVLKSCDEKATDLMNAVCEKIGSEPIASIGNKFTVYKRSDKKEIEHLL
ncbi:MAG TPA: YhbY family RNA-binding protein [Clostridia bacterium]|nr:YhbY family RNA-binding protein [Clostridia bacterium]